jgi:hypothetical protein
MDLIERTAKLAAEWWANLLEQGDKAAFQAHLQARIADRLRERGKCIVECDYDPKDILLEAVRAAGVECLGIRFSADGILPRKTETFITEGFINPCALAGPIDTHPIFVACDVGYEDHTVTVVGKFDDKHRFNIISITRE